jgi:hypothetical protein
MRPVRDVAAPGHGVKPGAQLPHCRGRRTVPASAAQLPQASPEGFAYEPVYNEAQWEAADRTRHL